MKQIRLLTIADIADQLDNKGLYQQANELDNRIEDLKNLVEIQCSNGNWDWDPYMHGLANGMILGLAVVEDKDPEFKDAPQKWLSSKAAINYLLASTPDEQAKGLSGIDPSKTKGMLFVFPTSDVVSFHNKDCLAPISVYWIKDSKVIGQSALPKYDGEVVNITSPGPVNMVLERFASKEIKVKPPAFWRRNYDYGERRRKHAEFIRKIASCPHANRINVTVEGQPLEYCLDCQQAIDNNKEKRGDWSKQFFGVNVPFYNDVGFFDARPIDKNDFYS